MSEYNAEQEMEAIEKQVGGWYSDFLDSPQYKSLSISQKDEAPGIVRFFAEYSFRYVGVEPERWNSSSVTECCAEILPRKVTAELPFFQAVAPVLSAFFTFLAEKNLLSNARPLARTVAELDAEIVAASQDGSNWGPAKGLAMAARKAGVDLCDQEAFHRFMVLHNLQILARQQALPAPAPLPSSLPASVAPVRRSEPKVGRNDPCPCGSGKKFKKCCGP